MLSDKLAVKTTCPYCGVGCGVEATPLADGSVAIAGDKSHPANFGRLCSKGSALGETLGLDGRLLYPQMHGQRCSWDAALDAVAHGFKRIIAEHGPQAVALYVSGQFLTEDYYVANKWMKGYIGTGNIDTNSRLCMASSVAGHKRAFGSDTVPGNYEDLELADLIVLVGSNLAWCHPVIYQRIVAAKALRPEMKIVVIDPRRTSTCDLADLHLPISSGTDTVLWNGLLHSLRSNDRIDFPFLEAHTEGYAAALEMARQTAGSIPIVAQACGLKEQDVAQFFQWFARTERVVSVFSQGVNQSSSGTDKVNAIINCHLVTGRIGKPGMGPFSVTGQPNAMGGREVGGLANQLAAHLEIDNPLHQQIVQRFWGSPVIATAPGLKAVDMFKAVGDGRIKAIWIMATNPVVSLPDADQVRKALEKCELVVVSDCVSHTDTMAHAHIKLPAAAWGEKDGTVTNSERRISRQLRFLPLPGEAQPDWWMIAQVAQRMGFGSGFQYQSATEIFREHAALSGFENDGRRDFDISALDTITEQDFANFLPKQWPMTKAQPQGVARMFGDGQFFTPSKRARLIPITPRLPQYMPDATYPLVLNTGRIRDQWHTMTRTGKSPRLSAHITEPYVELHPDDAKKVGAVEGSLVQVTSRWGKAIARAKVSSDQQQGSVFMPIHWSDQFASCARVDAVVNPVVDPISGEPESKHTPVNVEPYIPAWYGFLLSRRELNVAQRSSYWVRATGKLFWRYELAGEGIPDSWPQWARELLCAQDNGPEWIEYLDPKAGRYRGARLVNGRLESCIFIAPSFHLPPRTWLASLFEKEQLTAQERTSLLAGRPAESKDDAGKIVCACFGVGVNTLRRAIVEQHLLSVEAIGNTLKAGTNCGSCIPELKGLIAQHGQGNN